MLRQKVNQFLNFTMNAQVKDSWKTLINRRKLCQRSHACPATNILELVGSQQLSKGSWLQSTLVRLAFRRTKTSEVQLCKFLLQ